MQNRPETHRVFNALFLDPGLNNTGVSVYRIDQYDCKVLSIEAGTLKAIRLIDDSGIDDEVHEERVIKRLQMGRGLRAWLEIYRPDIVVTESPFFDRKKPNSFQILSEVLTTLYDEVLRYNRMVRFQKLAPQAVKKSLGVAGIKGKEIVKEAVEKTPLIMEHFSRGIDHLDEHAIDATAVGYAWLKTKSELFTGE